MYLNDHTISVLNVSWDLKYIFHNVHKKDFSVEKFTLSYIEFYELCIPIKKEHTNIHLPLRDPSHHRH